MPLAIDRRAAPRIRTELETYFSSANEEGRAILADVSASGALLAQTALRPRVGTRVRLTVFLSNSTIPMHVVGHIVRCTEDGFAIVYENPHPEFYDLVKNHPGASAGGESDRGAAGELGEPAAGAGGRAARRRVSAQREDAREAVREALEAIIDAALSARRGGAQPMAVLAMITDRARSALAQLDE